MKDDLEQATKLLEKLQQMMEPAVRTAYDSAIQVVQMNAVSNLVAGVICLLAVYLTVRNVPNEKIEKWLESNDFIPSIGVLCLCILSGVVFVIGVVTLLSPWNWVAVFNPELALARKLLGL